MSNSRLLSYIDLSGGWDTRASEISRIVIHHSAGVCTLENFSSICRTPMSISWHYGIANDGKIGMYVEEQYRAWAIGDDTVDNTCVSIMISNSSISNSWPISNAAYDSLLYLLQDICQRNNITRLTYTGKLQGSNLILHRWFKDVPCPGDYLVSKIPNIIQTVNQRLQSNYSLPYFWNDSVGLTAYDADVLGTTELPQELISND